jgi:hypothetical protein
MKSSEGRHVSPALVSTGGAGGSGGAGGAAEGDEGNSLISVCPLALIAEVAAFLACPVDMLSFAHTCPVVVDCVKVAAQLRLAAWLKDASSVSTATAKTKLGFPTFVEALAAVERNPRFTRRNYNDAMFAVLSGNFPLDEEIIVGGIQGGLLSTAQLPPAHGDSWMTRHPVLLRRGVYRAVVKGGVNPVRDGSVAV